MSDYPNYTLEQLADLILRLDVKEGVSPAGLGALQMFAKSALENASQQSFAPDAAHACCQRCHELSGDQKCQWCRHKRRARNVNR